MMAAFFSWLSSRLPGRRLGTIGNMPGRRAGPAVSVAPDGGVGEWWRWGGSGAGGVGRRASVVGAQRRQGAFQALDRVARSAARSRRLGDGSAQAPRRARALEPGQHQAGRRFGGSRFVVLFLVGEARLAWPRDGSE